MYHAPLRYGFGAGARYNQIDIDARVDGATPHQLVAILFEELLKSIDALRAAQRGGDRARMAAPRSRAITILQGLEASLDHDKGGDIAPTLARVYREARRLLTNGSGDQAAQLDQARRMVGEIAGAWLSIG